MKQNEIERWQMISAAGVSLFFGLVGLAALPVIFVFAPSAAIGPLLPIAIIAAFAGIFSIKMGFGYVGELLVANSGEPSFVDKVAGNKLSPAGDAMGLTAQASEVKSFTRVRPGSDQVQPEAGVADRPDGDRATSPALARS